MVIGVINIRWSRSPFIAPSTWFDTDGGIIISDQLLEPRNPARYLVELGCIECGTFDSPNRIIHTNFVPFRGVVGLISHPLVGIDFRMSLTNNTNPSSAGGLAAPSSARPQNLKRSVQQAFIEGWSVIFLKGSYQTPTQFQIPIHMHMQSYFQAKVVQPGGLFH